MSSSQKNKCLVIMLAVSSISLVVQLVWHANNALGLRVAKTWNAKADISLRSQIEKKGAAEKVRSKMAT